MSARFIAGRAGSGKTHHCLETIRARLRQDAARGNRLLLIVPEQASFQMERALIETPDLPAFTRCEVLSLQRLAYRVFAETGADPRRGDQTIGAFGRMMVIRRLIRRERSALRLLGAVADKPGLIERMSRTIDELMHEAIDPAQLTQIADQMGDSDPLASAKLDDVSRLYQAYLEYLQDDRIDPAQYLQLAAERLDGVPWLPGAEVWVDGFAGFTRQEYHLLAELSRRVANIEITMLVEPDAPALSGAQRPTLSYSRFARAERTIVRLRTELQARGVELADPIRLRGTTGASRFTAVELARLEQRLFVVPANGVTKAAPVAEATDACRAIRVVDFPDRRAEVEAAVAEIQRLTRLPNAPLRYRDIAIIVRDLGAYHDLISSAMRSRSIPCFIDRRQPTTHHPLIELVRGLMAVAVDDCRLNSVRLLLKTGLLPMQVEEADLLENYLIAHGIQGRQRWAVEWMYTRFFARGRSETDQISPAQQTLLARINQSRAAWQQWVGPWLALTADRAQATGRAWAVGLFACLERVEAGARLESWVAAARADGAPDAADMHRQVWQDFLTLLDEFVNALGDESMQVDEFRETLEAGLADFNLGLAPPTLDSVLVGAIERSRHPELRAALLLGFDEAHYPMRRAEDPLLGDAEREALRSADAEIGPSRGQMLIDERMLAYIALTRAGERLWISHPRQAPDGKPLLASAYLRDVLEAVPGLAVEHAPDAVASRDADWVSSLPQLAARLAGEFRYRPRLAEDADPAKRASWNALYETARRQEDWQPTLRRCLAGLRQVNLAALAPGLIEQAVRLLFTASVSRLECFAACAFRHYAEYWLHLEERVEAEANQIDLGKVCHAILEKLVDDLMRDNQRIADLQDDDITERVDQIVRTTLPSIAADVMLDDARSEFLLDRSRGHLARVTRWQRDFAARGKFRPAAVEFAFGFRGTSPVRLRTPKGREVLLRGRIDRVDVAELGDELLGLVVDYKRSHDRRLHLVEVYHGLALQLVGYLLALRQAGESLAGRRIRPIAALYLPLLEPYRTVTHPDQPSASAYRCRGVIDESALAVIDDSVQPGTAGSSFIAARLKNDGQPYAAGDLAATAELSALIGHVEQRMGQLADDIIDGRVGIEPFRLHRHMPCSFCSYKAICRYEIETQPFRKLEGMKRSDVLSRVLLDSQGAGEPSAT